MTNQGGKTARQPMDLDLAQVPEGRVHVIAERCKECNFCITYCPADVLVYSEDTNLKGYRYPEIVDGKEHDCILCRFCDMICPELAIFTTNVADEEAKESAKEPAEETAEESNGIETNVS